MKKISLIKNTALTLLLTAGMAISAVQAQDESAPAEPSPGTAQEMEASETMVLQGDAGGETATDTETPADDTMDTEAAAEEPMAKEKTPAEESGADDNMPEEEKAMENGEEAAAMPAESPVKNEDMSGDETGGNMKEPAETGTETVTEPEVLPVTEEDAIEEMGSEESMDDMDNKGESEETAPVPKSKAKRWWGRPY